jgi:hypothetical protein
MKKKIVLFIGCIFFTCIVLNAQVRVAMPINPSSPADTYPTHIDTLGHGGFMAVRTKAIRDNITIQRRKEGMLVYVLETDSLYQLRGPVTGNNWVQFKLMASAVNTINTGTSGNDVNSAISPDGNTLTLNIPDASPTARGVVTTATQTFGGNKIFNDGVSVDGLGSTSYKGKLKLGINSTMSAPGLGYLPDETEEGTASRRASKYLVVNENGEVMLAPFVNRYVTIQKKMDISRLWQSYPPVALDKDLDILPGDNKLLFVNFISELQSQYGLQFWGTNIVVSVMNAPTNEILYESVGYLVGASYDFNVKGLIQPQITVIPRFDPIYLENAFPMFYLVVHNHSPYTLRVSSNLEIIVSVTFDLLDPYIDGIYGSGGGGG